MLDDLWLLWELVLLGEPLVVMAPEPGICSESVVALIDLINPVSWSLLHLFANPNFSPLTTDE